METTSRAVYSVTSERTTRAKFVSWLLTALVAAGIASSVSFPLVGGASPSSGKPAGNTSVLGVQIAGPSAVQNVGNALDCVDDAKNPTGKSILPPCPKSFSIGGNISGLFPGAHLNLPVLVTNQNSQDIKVMQIQITVTGTDKADCSTGTTNLQPTNYTGPGFVVARNSTVTVLMPITMPGSVANACQGATFQLRYSGSAVKP